MHEIPQAEIAASKICRTWFFFRIYFYSKKHDTRRTSMMENLILTVVSFASGCSVKDSGLSNSEIIGICSRSTWISRSSRIFDVADARIERRIDNNIIVVRQDWGSIKSEKSEWSITRSSVYIYACSAVIYLL